MSLPHLALALLINLLWGFNFIVAKVGVTHIPPIAFTALRFFAVALMLLPFLRLVRGQGWPLLGAALFAGAFHFSLIFTGTKLAEDVSIVAIVTQLSIPFSTVLAVFFLNERIGWRRASGIALSFGGVLVMGFDPRVIDDLDAVAMVTVAGLSIAIGQILMRRLHGVGVFNMQAWVGIVSFPTLALLSFGFESGQVQAMEAAPSIAWAAVLYTAIAASLIGHGGMYFLLRHYPVSLVSPLLVLSPVFGALFSIWIFGDQWTPRIALGAVMTLGGVLVILLRQKKIAAPE